MKKTLFILLLFFCFYSSATAQYSPLIQDCKELTSCTVNNNHSFPKPGGGTLTGARAYVEYLTQMWVDM